MGHRTPLRQAYGTAIAGSNRSVADRGRARRVVADRAQGAGRRRGPVAPEPEPSALLGIDETRFGSVRWILDGITWRRSDPWMTSFVDCTPGHPGALLALAPGRTGGCVRDWLGEQSEAFRRRIEIVVIDPSAPYASAIRAALPGVKIAIDKWHLVALANTMVTEVRQRVTRSLLGRRGTVRRSDLGQPAALADRRRAPVEPSSGSGCGASFDTCDPTKQIQAAWAVKERLRLMLAEQEPAKIRRRLADFYEAAIDAQLPEAARLAGTDPDLVAGNPHLLSLEDVDNARTERFNRIIKQTKRVGCGYRNMINYQRRILSHIAVTRPQRSAA